MKKATVIKTILSILLVVMALPLWAPKQVHAQKENDPRATENVIREKSLGVEVLAKRTPKSKTYFNPEDNTFTTKFNSGYLHYRDRSGKFRDIDRRIVPSSDSSFFEVTRGFYRAKFEFNLTDTAYPVTFETRAGIRFRSKPTALAYFDRVSKRIKVIQRAQKSNAVVTGNKIRYPEIFPGVAVEYEYGDTKFKQNILLSQQARAGLPNAARAGFNSPNAFLVVLTSFDVPDDLEAAVHDTVISARDAGRKVRLAYEGKGAVEFRDVNGKGIFALLQDFAFTTSGGDSVASDEALGQDKVASRSMQRRFYTVGEENFMLTGVPLRWLNSQPAGTIVLDPTVSLSAPTDDVWIEYNKSSNYNAYTQLRIGRGYGYGWKRSLVKFDVSAIPEDANVSSASLDLYFYSKYGTSISRTIQCHQVLKDWKEAQATWYNRVTGTAWGTNGVGLDGIDAKAAAEASQSWYNEYPTWKNYDLTSLTQDWVDGTASNYGVVFWATNEDDFTNGDEKWVYSSEYGTVSKRPKLIVSYTVDPLVAYQYDAFGRPTTVTYANGVTETSLYDADRGWITNRDYKDGSSNVFKFENTTYDAAGILKKQQFQHTNSSLESMEYVYDNLAQITQFKHETVLKRSYAYDDNGNLTTFTGKTMTYGNKNNQLTSDGSRNFTFDEVGRAKQIGSTNLSYDIFNNMTDHGTDSYTYDAFNQRLRKTENSTSTYYVTSGPQILAEYTSDADPDAEYIYGLSGMAVRFDPEVGHHWFFTDHLGSTREMGLPETSGDPDMRRDYYPYGDNYAVAGNDETAYQFTGKELDNGIGLHYFGSRYYDRSIGRWFVPDPAGQYFSPYVYAGSSPLNIVDPDGAFAIAPILVMAAWQGFVNYQITGDLGSSFKAAGISAAGGIAGGFASGLAPAGILPGAGYGAAAGGVVGGVTSQISGGGFGSGFVSGGISGAVTGGIDGYERALEGGLNIWTGALPKPNPIPGLTIQSVQRAPSRGSRLSGRPTYSRRLAEVAAYSPLEEGLLPPVDPSYRITSPFTRSIREVRQLGLLRPHTALDIGTPYGTPILSPRIGNVIFSGNTQWGVNVRISHPYLGGTLETSFLHLSRNVVRAGMVVTRGQIIGYTGTYGTGAHLHFRVRLNGQVVNPLSVFPFWQ